MELGEPESILMRFLGREKGGAGRTKGRFPMRLFLISTLGALSAAAALTSGALAVQDTPTDINGVELSLIHI